MVGSPAALGVGGSAAAFPPIFARQQTMSATRELAALFFLLENNRATYEGKLTFYIAAL